MGFFFPNPQRHGLELLRWNDHGTDGFVSLWGASVAGRHGGDRCVSVGFGQTCDLRRIFLRKFAEGGFCDETCV